MPRGNPQKLKGYPRTTQEARERGKAGAAKSIEVRRKQKAERESMKTILKAMTAQDLKKIMEAVKDDEKLPKMMAAFGGMKPLQAVAFGQVLKAVTMLDTSAAAFVRDTAGEKPVEEQKTTFDGGISVTIKVLD
jgi:hypothetical protein